MEPDPGRAARDVERRRPFHLVQEEGETRGWSPSGCVKELATLEGTAAYALRGFVWVA